MIRAVDLFSGAGGWSCGAAAAGVQVVAGANHWPRAVETFRAAHPEAQARCQDGDRLRMLSVDEQRTAMGFPSDYPLTGTRAEQVHQLGNAVCPPVASHVVRQLLESTQ